MMKRILLLFIVLSSVVSLFAQQTSSDTNKHRMIAAVNRGDYSTALTAMDKVKNWSFDSNNDNDWFDIEKAFTFAEYAMDRHVQKSKIDSLWMYIATECQTFFAHYYYNGASADAIPFAELVQMIYSIVYGEQHPEYAASLSDLGVLYSDVNNYSKAEEYHQQALSIRQSTLGYSHPDCATSLLNLGGLYYEQGLYTKAELHFQRALKIYKSALGEKDVKYAATLDNLGLLYQAIGNYANAESYHLQSAKIYKDIYGGKHSEYAVSLNNLGGVYHNNGKYNEAEACYLEALDIYKSKSGESHPDCADAMDNLGALYRAMGNYKEAEIYHLKAFEIRKATLGEKHINYATSAENLGVLYYSMGNNTKAEYFYSEAMKVQKSILGETHPDYARSLQNIGTLYKDIGNYPKAEESYLNALEIRKAAVGEKHPDYAFTLDNLGGLYRIMGNYNKSERYHLRALETRKSALGENHPDYVHSLHNLGLLYYTMKDYKQAYSYIHASVDKYKRHYLSSLNHLTEQQREQYWITMQERFDYFYPMFVYRYYISQPSVLTFAYDNELFRKGLLLSSADAVRQSVLESGNTTLINQWNQLTAIKQNIMTLEENDPLSHHLQAYRNSADSLEKIITRSSAAYRTNQAMGKISWEIIRQNLQPNEVAIEYFSAPINEDSTMYCALLLRSDSSTPTLIPLFEEQKIATMLLSNEVTNNDIYNFNSKGKQISQIIWGKILPKIKTGETIYFSPAGMLHQIAIEYLPYDAQRTMSDVYTMVRLSSTREIAINQSPNKNTTATIYGGIQYSMYAEELLLESEPYQRAIAGTSRSANNINRGIVQYLPGTKTEANTINALMKKNNIITKLYTESKANEESFKALSGKHSNILHIGTHGFMWTDNTTTQTDPLNRCGLLFAGSNIALSGRAKELDKGVQDGILTAKEISLLDLRGADLVVLSACETAKGDITSEGVFGLQRAFKMAGVQTIIMSLWKVDDLATQMLMTEFYTNWIGNKYASKRAAFTKAQKTVKAKYPSPEYWAGFILLD